MAKPKVISLLQGRSIQECFPHLNLMGRTQDMFIECQSFDVIIQVRAAVSHELDIFEDAVLRMVMIQAGSANELAENLCLPADLIKLILLRLQEKGYLSDAHTLSQQGIKILGDEQTQEEKVEPLMVKIFQIPLTGQILPYIHQGELQTADVVDNSKGFTLEFGSHGEPKTVKGRYLRCGFNQGKRISQRECVKAFEIYNRLVDGATFKPIDYLKNWAIDATSGERFYIHMQAAIQKGNADFPLISDGFVPNIDGLSEYVDHENPDMLAYVRQNALELQQDDWVDTSGNQRYGKYREIYKELEAIKKITVISLEESAEGEENARDVTLLQGEIKQDLIRHYAVILEWVFFYYSAENPVSAELMSELCRGNNLTNTELLLTLAKKLGIAGIEEHRGIFSRLSEMSIRRVENNKMPDFFVNFPLSVAEASESSGGPLRELLVDDPRMLGFLDRLFQVYRSLRHGGNSDGGGLDLNEVREKCLECVLALVPDIQEDDLMQNSIRQKLTVRDVSNKRIAARVALERMMGSMYFNSLPAYVQDDWMRISPDKAVNRLPDPYNYINILYRIFEVSLRDALAQKGHLTKAIPVNEGVALAEKNWKSKLPLAFTTISDVYFHSAQNGEKATLGASALYYLCRAQEDELEPLRKLNFVDCISRVLSYRRHGNAVGLCLDEEILSKLRKDTMMLTKQLGGF